MVCETVNSTYIWRRVTQHHDEERQLAPGSAHRDGAVFAPVDLGAFAGGEVSFRKLLCRGGRMRRT